MLLSQGVLKHVGQRSPGLNPNWLQAGKQKPHTSTNFCDHGCATRLCKTSDEHRVGVGDVLAVAAPAILCGVLHLMASFPGRKTNQSANIRFLSSGL